MLGFWRDVCLSAPAAPERAASAAADLGPNVPYGGSAPQDSWKEEFRPASIAQHQIVDVAATQAAKESPDVDVVDPLWVPIRRDDDAPEETGLEAPAEEGEGLECAGRFFLKSLDSTDIDHKVVYGAWPTAEKQAARPTESK